MPVVMVATVTALVVVEVLDRRRTTTSDVTRPAPAVAQSGRGMAESDRADAQPAPTASPSAPVASPAASTAVPTPPEPGSG
jgi:hypothetical protein